MKIFYSVYPVEGPGYTGALTIPHARLEQMPLGVIDGAMEYEKAKIVLDMMKLNIGGPCAKIRCTGAEI